MSVRAQTKFHRYGRGRLRLKGTMFAKSLFMSKEGKYPHRKIHTGLRTGWSKVWYRKMVRKLWPNNVKRPWPRRLK